MSFFRSPVSRSFTGSDARTKPTGFFGKVLKGIGRLGENLLGTFGDAAGGIGNLFFPKVFPRPGPAPRPAPPSRPGPGRLPDAPLAAGIGGGMPGMGMLIVGVLLIFLFMGKK